ncbi:MAG: MarR family winged helix-turn-helix transcriptional regulator [Spirochaetaceae bacterium]|nr:MarR family winged helix-turn-helix transcriptional regulator [Spirochaetaceae bacterium]
MTESEYTVDPKTIPDQCIAFNIGKAYRSVLNRFEEEFAAKAGISTTQYGLLVHIAKLEPANGKTICGATGHDPSTLSRNMKGLIETGLVEACRSCSEDRRIVNYSLSESGRHRLAQAIPVWYSVHQSIIRGLGDEQSAQLLWILKKLQALENDS